MRPDLIVFDSRLRVKVYRDVFSRLEVDRRMEVSQHWRLKKERYNLIGSVCPQCGYKSFPPRQICPRCARYMEEISPLAPRFRVARPKLVA